MYHLQDEEVDYDYPHIHQESEDSKMTICIGAICEEGSAACLIADKMTTYQFLDNFQKENEDIVKIHRINNTLFVACSGNTCSTQEFLDEARLLKQTTDYEVLTHAYNEVSRKQAMEKCVEARGMTYQQYLDHQRSMNEALVLKIDDEITKHHIGINVLGISWDTNKNTYLIGIKENKYKFGNFTNSGFCATGGTLQIAEYVILKSTYNKKYTLDETKKLLLKAKKECEHFAGIGKTHDIVCLKNGQVVESTI